MLLRSAYASRTKRKLRGRGPSHRDQNPFGGKGGERRRRPPSGRRTERLILNGKKKEGKGISFARLTPRAPGGSFGAAAPHTGIRTHSEGKAGKEGDDRLPAAALNRSYFRLGNRSPSARSTQQSGKEKEEGEGEARWDYSGILSDILYIFIKYVYLCA